MSPLRAYPLPPGNGKKHNAAAFRAYAPGDAAGGQILSPCQKLTFLSTAALNGILLSSKRHHQFPQMAWMNMSALYILLPVTMPEISSRGESAAFQEDNGNLRKQLYCAWSFSKIDNTAP